jgi:hypothetical protein
VTNPRNLPVPASVVVVCAVALFSCLGLEFFKVYDWDHGVIRTLWIGAFAVGAALVASLAPRFVRLRLPENRWVRVLLLVAVVFALGFNVYSGIQSVRRTAETDELLLDQGQITVRSLEFLREGRNPYSREAMLDVYVIGHFWRNLLNDDGGRCYDGELTRQTVDRLLGVYWQSLDRDLAAQLRPEISTDPECEQHRRVSTTLGCKYGPGLLACFAPFYFTFGKPGIYVFHLVLLGAVLGLMYLLTRRSEAPTWSFALVVVIAMLPFPVRHNTLYYSTNDLLPTALALSFFWLLESGRHRSAMAVLGCCMTTKLMPGALYELLALEVPRRHWPYAFVAPLLLYSTFLLWDLRGFVDNVFLWYFFILRSDSTAWAHYLDPGAQNMLKLAGGLTILGTLIHTQRQGRTPLNRAVYLCIAHGAMLVSGPYFHNNYLVWFAPVLGLTLARGLVREQGPPCG